MRRTDTSEAAYYENTDPSGTGFRVTPRLMPANWWDYSDQRKAEFDSGNSNVGLETNYQPVYEPGPSENLPLESESPLYVDGQKASVTIDGISVSWLIARQMAEAGSAIPAGLASYQSLPGFQFTSNGLGNFSVTIPRQVGWNVTYGPNDGPNGTAHPVYRGSDTYSFSADWTRSTPGFVQTQGNEPIPSKDDLKKLLTRRQDLYDGGCRKFLEQVLRNVRAKETSFEEVFDNFTKKHGFAESGHGGGWSHVGKGDIGLPTLSAATNDAQRYQKQMKFVQTLIHELLHRIGKSHSDMARAAFDALTEEEQRENRLPDGDSERSTYTTRMINSKCRFNPNDPAEVDANIVR